MQVGSEEIEQVSLHSNAMGCLFMHAFALTGQFGSSFGLIYTCSPYKKHILIMMIKFECANLDGLVWFNPL